MGSFKPESEETGECSVWLWFKNITGVSFIVSLESICVGGSELVGGGKSVCLCEKCLLPASMGCTSGVLGQTYNTHGKYMF